MSLPWTEDRVEALKKLWLSGFSASQIAGELGGVSRNAVIGKVHRLKLAARAKSPAASAPKPPRKVAAPRPQATAAARTAVRGNTALALTPMVQMQPAIVVVPEDVVIPFSQRVTIMELREGMCKWPMGDPQESEFRYCGTRKEETGKPYCTYHCARAFQPVIDRRRDRRLQ